MVPDTPAGFSLRQFTLDIQHAFREAFYIGEDYPVFNEIFFSPIYPFQENVGATAPGSEVLDFNMNPPSCFIDLYEFKTDPSFDEFRHEETSTYSNLGNLGIYLYMRALIIVSNRFDFSWYQVRKLAIDVAGVVTNLERFGAKVGMSQVTEISEVPNVRQRSDHYIGWQVLWQHSVELEPPDYSSVEMRRAFSMDVVDDNVAGWKVDAADISLVNLHGIGTEDPETKEGVEFRTDAGE